MALSALPARLDIVVPQGTDWTYPVAVKDGAGTLLSLTGWTARAQVRAEIDDASPALTIACTVGTFGTAPNQYNLELVVADTTSAAVADWGKGRWDLELVDTFGNVARIAEGTAVLSREVTR